MPDVVIRAQYSDITAAENAVKRLDGAIRDINSRRLDLASQIADSVSAADRLAIKLREVNDQISAMKMRGQDVGLKYEEKIGLMQQLTAQKSHTVELQAQDRLLEKQLGRYNADLKVEKEILNTAIQRQKEADNLAKAEAKAADAKAKAETKAAQEAARAKAKADKEALDALTKRQTAALKAENSFADLRKREIEAARIAAIDSGRSTPQNFEEYTAMMERQKTAADELARAEQEERQARIDADTARRAADRESEIQRMEEERQAAENLAAAIESVAQAFNTLGGISGGIADFSTGIANSFQGMASMFSDVSVTDTLKRLATKYVTEAFAGDLSSAISRYDILSTFVPYMSAAGVDEQTANASLSRVNEAIIGIPIGLDEAAQRLRRYQMFLGNVDDATNLTIGAQNAIIAGGASEQMKNMAYLQIDRLLAAGRLNTSRQWLSLIQGLGVSMNYVSQAMGTDNMTPKELAAGLTSGEISTESFLAALMELGKGESDAAQGLNNLLTIYKGTIEAWQASISYASTRGQANVIDALSDSLETFTGQGVTGYMKDYRDFINDVYKGINSFVSSNPTMLVAALEKFNQLIDSVSKFSASEFATNVFSRLGEGVDLISRALEHIPAGKLEEFAAFATTLAGPIGTGMLASSGLGQVLGVFERFKSFDFGQMIDSIAREVERMASVVAGLLGVIPDGLMSNLMAFGLVWGRPLAAVFTTIAGAVNSIAQALKATAVSTTLGEAFRDGGILGWVIKLAQAHPMITAATTAILGLVAALALLHGKEEAAVRDATDNLGLGFASEDLSTTESLVKSIQRSTEARNENAEAIERQSIEAENLRQHILDLNGQDLDAAGFADLEASVERLNQIVPEAGAAIDETTGYLTAQSAAALQDADAFEQLIIAMENAAQKAAIVEVVANKAALEVNKSILAEDKKAAYDTWRSAESDYQLWLKGRTQYGTLTDDERARYDYLASQNVDYEANARAAKDAFDKETDAWYDNQKAIEDNARELAKWEAEYKKTSAQLKESEGDIVAQTEALEDLKQVSLELAKTNLAQTLREISQGVDESAAGFEKWELPKPIGQGGEGFLTKDIENMETEAAFYNTASKNLDRVREYLFESWDKLTVPEGVDSTGLRTNLINYINEVLGTDDEETAAQKINNVLAAFDELDWDTLLKLGEGKGATDEATQNFKDSVEALAQAAEEANDAAERANTSLETLPELLNEIKEKQEEASKALQEALQGSSFEEQEGSWFERVGSSVQGKFDAAKGVLSEYADSLSQMVAAYQTNAAELEISALSMQASMQQVQEASEEASEEVSQNTEKMSSEVSQNMSTMASNTETSVSDTISSINRLAPSIAAQVPLATAAALNLGTGIAQGLQAGVSAAQNAASQIAAAAASITAAVQQAASAAAGLGTGGGGEVSGEAITLATGGSVFSPFGSDIVPAMLTPGEYIIRKGAADFFGRGLLERINALDIGGAFDRLILNSPVTAGRFGGNVYNKDNHASVVQNYYNSSPDYGNRRAWRFAHSL